LNQDWAHQASALEADLTAYDAGTRRMMNVMATGTGKTHVFGRVFDVFKSRLPGQQLVLVHTKELARQANTRLTEMYGDTVKIGIDMGTVTCDSESDIIVGSVKTLGREETTRVDKYNWNRIDKLVIDEAHHSTGDSYRRVLELSGSLAPDTDKLLLGVTATPNRPDGAGLSDIYEKVTFVYSLRQAIKDGILSDVKGWRVKTSTSLAGVTVTGGDFVKSELSKVVDNTVRNAQIVSAWEKHGSDRRTLVFCVDVQHAKDVADEFQKAGYAADWVSGDDPDRDAKILAHSTGKLQILCNCNVLTEGYDDPAISCIVLARPTVSAILFAQMVGRGTRKAPGKTDCIVLDVVDNTTRNSLMTLPSLLGIIASLDMEGRSILEVVEEMEAAQDEYPTIDLTKLDSISELTTVISQVDLFEIRFPAEVEANSELTWFRAVDGGFKMRVPKETAKEGWVRIFENALGQWEIVADINDEPLHGIRPSMEEAFKAADEAIRKRVSNRTLACVKREGTWQNKPLLKYPKLIKMLQRFFKGREFPLEHMTAGQASRLINDRLNKLKK
jgi:ATP-dependent helicase IRC3